MPKITREYRKRRCRTPGELIRKYPRTYSSWRRMLDRILQDEDYIGLELEESWLNFATFIKDMGVRPSWSHSISRKNHDIGYNKESCFWELISSNSRESRLRNENKINSPTNNRNKRIRMTGAKLWHCLCGRRCYSKICKSCGASK